MNAMARNKERNEDKCRENKSYKYNKLNIVK